jgi:alpha-ketoglutarate-dependent taurine dioxygenase
VDPASPDLELVIGGRPARFPAVWLRDNCPCPDCLAPGTGQKLNDITDIPNGLAITRTEDAGESVLVTFAPDQHRSAFPRSWLEEHALDGERDGDGRTEDDKELWLPADLDGLPYRDPVPTVQLLHCLHAAVKGDGEAGGGDTGLVDGFAAAAELRATDPGSFGTLAKTPVPFGYIDKETELRASLPLIQLNPSGRVRGIRFNNRSMRPLRRPYAEVTAFYTAYRRWAELLTQPGRQLNLRLAPGDCLVFDNTRVLHARTAFSMNPGSPERHLQGCYADLDGLASTLAVLKRRRAGDRNRGHRRVVRRTRGPGLPG